ncbi:MAG TPA: hypothetical protein VFZ63_13290 [Jiangellaceae bacterium]
MATEWWGDYEPIIGGTPTVNGGATNTYSPWAISIAVDFWDAEVRTAAEPDAPFDWFPWLVMAAIAAAVLLILQTTAGYVHSAIGGWAAHQGSRRSYRSADL